MRTEGRTTGASGLTRRDAPYYGHTLSWPPWPWRRRRRWAGISNFARERSGPVKTLEHPRVDATDRLRRRFRSYALVSGIGTYLLIVFGGIVRITGSGLGCGDDWPLCNGQLLPPWDLATWIEWTHRLLAAGLALPIVATAVYGVRRRLAGDPAPGSVAAVAAVVLLIVQVALGAITVKLELPPVVTALHFVNAMLMLGALISAAVAAGGEPGLIEDG